MKSCQSRTTGGRFVESCLTSVVTVCLLLSAGCRSEADLAADRLLSSGISVQRTSDGQVFWIETSGADVGESFWESLSEFPQLTTLGLSGSPVEDEDLARLISYDRLETLDLSYTRATSAGIPILQRLTRLQTLSLNGLKLDDSCIESLSRFTGLRALSLIDCGIESESYEVLRTRLNGCIIVR